LALVLDKTSQSHPDWRLPQLIQELNLVASNERRFLGFTGEDTGFDPDLFKGKVIVTTMHKAKGLEWDRVYLLSASNYDFPSAEPGDSYIAEKWFVRDRINLQAETIARLKALVSGDKIGVVVEEGYAGEEARLEYASERLRLFYVGITRARKELMITWNTGKKGESKPCLAFTALYDFWKNNL
jgi:DNA helicase-2/ATP-dependent DNA helicase PcrA